MTSNIFMSNLFRKGKQVFQGILKSKTRNVGVKAVKISEQIDCAQSVVRFQSSLPPGRINNIWRRVLPKVYFRSLARDLGHRAAWQRARNLPLFAFVGLVVAQHADEEDHEIANRIQDLVKAVDTSTSSLLQRVQELSLDKFEFGQLIGQGCNAAVYEACLKPDEHNVSNSSIAEEHIENDIEVGTDDSDNDSNTVSTASMQGFADSDDNSDIVVLDLTDEEISDSERAPLIFQVDDDTESDITVLSHLDEDDDCENAPHMFYVDDDRINDLNDEEDSDSDFSLISWSDLEDELESHPSELIVATGNVSSQLSQTEEQDNAEDNVEDSENCCLEQVESDVTDPVENEQMYNSLDSSYSEVGDKYNLAVKMMFNYGVESNADAILNEMDRETVPARLAHSQGRMLPWQNGNKVRKKSLPPHTNIVEMWGVFVDPVPHLPDSLLNYPAALPARINPNGIGRNMTMFLVMKKYQYTLKEYLSTFNPSFRERLFLLGQLLEGVAHMRRHGIAHRDLKLDNIFLDTTTGVFPQLVIGDFGCCLADTKHGMQIPYPTEHMDRGGNTALMAPEISTAEPGMFQYLDYRKADLWAVGALAFEILGADNPFYSNKTGQRLDSRTYNMSELPPLPDTVPRPVKSLVYSMLDREPNKRPSARVAADIVHVLLWAPSDWLLPGNSVSKSEVTWWIVTMATEVLLGAKSPERLLKRNFIQNFNMNNLKSTFNFFDIKM